MVDEPVVVQLADWVRRVPARPRGAIRRQAGLAMVVAVALVLLVVLSVLGVVLDVVPRQALVGALLLSVIAVALGWTSRVRLRSLGDGPADEPVSLVAPHAFVIQTDRLRFPAHQGRPAEDWPVADVAATVRGGSLVLSADGHRTRRWPARVLAEPPARIVERVRAAGGR